MDKPIIEIKLKNKVLRIYQDTDPQDPRKDDMIATMLSVHPQYEIGDDSTIKTSEQLNQFIEDKKDQIAIMKRLYLLDHSGLVISTGPFSCDSQGWDTSIIGVIYIEKETLIKEFGKVDLDKAKEIIDYEIEEYNQYLSGDVYGFELVDLKECKTCNHIEELILDSCWGFYGTDWDDNGVLDYLPNEFKEALKETELNG